MRRRNEARQDTDAERALGPFHMLLNFPSGLQHGFRIVDRCSCNSCSVLEREIFVVRLGSRLLVGQDSLQQERPLKLSNRSLITELDCTIDYT
jgi:hypothetical protein